MRLWTTTLLDQYVEWLRIARRNLLLTAPAKLLRGLLVQERRKGCLKEGCLGGIRSDTVCEVLSHIAAVVFKVYIFAKEVQAGVAEENFDFLGQET